MQIQVYGKMAESAATTEEAFSALQKCLDAARACSDSAAQGAAHHQLGLLAQREGDHAEALGFQREFLALSAAEANKAAVARAYYSIAECHEALGEVDAAVVALETYMDMTRMSSPVANARACCKFGFLYFTMRKFSQVRRRCCDSRSS